MPHPPTCLYRTLALGDHMLIECPNCGETTIELQPCGKWLAGEPHDFTDVYQTCGCQLTSAQLDALAAQYDPEEHYRQKYDQLVLVEL